MMRPIDADKVEECVKDWSQNIIVLGFDMVGEIMNAINSLPTIEAAPVVHGEWIKHEYAEESEGRLIPNFECSVCHDWKREETPFCPECGARMDGKAVRNEI